MFTGIVSDVGAISVIDEIPAGRRLRIATSYPYADIDIGSSIACSGICHTVCQRGAADGQNWFEVISARETLAVTTARHWQVGDAINLERALCAHDRLDGHIVQGHVDGVARIIARRDGPEAIDYTLRAPADLARFIAVKGSVALNGTSLTVNQVAGQEFRVFLVPHTITHTDWHVRREGDLVNLEVDILARYVARLAEQDGVTAGLAQAARP